MSTYESGETVKPVPTLKEILSNAVFSPTIAIPDGIKKIDLGQIGIEAEGILKRTLSDPERLERSRTVIVNQNRSVEISTKDDVGFVSEHGQNVIPSPVSFSTVHGDFVPYHQKYSRYIGGLVHSHGEHDVPMSPSDFYWLFGNTDKALEIAPMIMVITPELKQVYFRGKNTPQWNNNFLEEKVSQWNNMLINNINNKIIPGMTKKQIVGINAIAIHKYIRSMKEKYDLRLYSCPVSSNTVVEESG